MKVGTVSKSAIFITHKVLAVARVSALHETFLIPTRVTFVTDLVFVYETALWAITTMSEVMMFAVIVW